MREVKELKELIYEVSVKNLTGVQIEELEAKLKKSSKINDYKYKDHTLYLQIFIPINSADSIKTTIFEDIVKLTGAEDINIINRGKLFNIPKKNDEIHKYYEGETKTTSQKDEVTWSIIRSFFMRLDQESVKETEKELIIPILKEDSEIASKISEKIRIVNYKYSIDSNDKVNFNILKAFIYIRDNSKFSKDVELMSSIYLPLMITLKNFDIEYDLLFKELFIFKDGELKTIKYLEDYLTRFELNSRAINDSIKILYLLKSTNIQIMDRFFDEIRNKGGSISHIDKLFELYGFDNGEYMEKLDFIHFLVMSLKAIFSSKNTELSKHYRNQVGLIIGGSQGKGKTYFVDQLFTFPYFLNKYGISTINQISINNIMNDGSQDFALAIYKTKKYLGLFHKIDDLTNNIRIEENLKSYITTTHQYERTFGTDGYTLIHMFEPLIGSTNSFTNFIKNPEGIPRRLLLLLANKKVNIKNLDTELFNGIQSYILHEYEYNLQYQEDLSSTLEQKRIEKNKNVYTPMQKDMLTVLDMFNECSNEPISEQLTKEQIFNIIPMVFKKEDILNNLLNSEVIKCELDGKITKYSLKYKTNNTQKII